MIQRISYEKASAMRLLSGIIVSVFLSWAGTAHASTPAMPQAFTCPLTGESFQGYGGGSYTSFGATMDFEPMAMNMIHRSEFNIPQCPDSGLPLYRPFKADEVETLRGIVASPEWQEHRARKNVYYLVAFLQARLHEGEDKVANSLLRAIWTSSDADRPFYIDKALPWWARLAGDARDHDRQWIVANWLLVDLNRQAGHFGAASSALQDVRAKLPVGVEPVTTAMMDYERRLIANRDTESRKAPERAKR